MNSSQREYTAKTLLDLGKAIAIVFVIGGFIPNSPITLFRMILSLVFVIILYLSAMFLLGGDDI